MSNFTKPIKYIHQIKNPLIKPCPCAKGHISCGYIVISHILNCPYNCSYCYLQTFFGRDEIVIYNNEDKIIQETKEYMNNAKTNLRIGTGEFSDSLAIPEAVSLAKKLVGLFSEQKKHLLELKTKSVNIDGLLNLEHNRQTVIGWSVNPQEIIDAEEPGTPSLAERLTAAKRCGGAGYLISFHFDPIIYLKDWEKEYGGVIELIFEEIPQSQIAWISLGALRFPVKQKEIIEKKHNSQINFKYFIQGKDNKLRYPPSLRIDLFTSICKAIHKSAPEVYLYLCMEEDCVWEKLSSLTCEGRYERFFNPIPPRPCQLAPYMLKYN